MDLSKRNFLLGLGIGIVSVSFVFYVAYAYDYMNYDAKLSAYMNEHLIIDLIKEREMLLYFKIDIPDNSGALEIAEILYNKSLIDDVLSFESYLIKQGINEIVNGYAFYVPVNADYSTIVEIIKNK